MHSVCIVAEELEGEPAEHDRISSSRDAMHDYMEVQLEFKNEINI